jgi:hypothetical protein
MAKKKNKYELKTRPTSEWVKVTEYIFRSWTGQRRINGVEYHGPCYYLGTDEIACVR